VTGVVEIVAELERQYVANELVPISDVIARWRGRSGEAELSLYDAIAAELARGYHEKRYSFSFCDSVINRLFAVLVSREQSSWPKLFKRVYDAFDAGEFHRRADKTDDPIAEYTDLEIAALVRHL
jgi:hypothetical protein